MYYTLILLEALRIINIQTSLENFHPYSFVVHRSILCQGQGVSGSSKGIKNFNNNSWLIAQKMRVNRSIE